ncbi:MAG TPA: hypothetical protein VG738_23110 [Chitinophagaceae bacterium]|nr:hypothetical protein [Chitinophagaceae bacterium]
MKPKPFFLLVAIAAAMNLCVRAQAPQLANIVKPSPNVAAMQKYGDIPISAYTGVPNISIPIYTIKFRDITVPVSLSYHASGIKVSEEASQVGLGWALNAAGTVSRNIIGQDDFLGQYFTSAPDFSDGLGPAGNVFCDNSGNPDNVGCQLNVFDKRPGSTQTYYSIDLKSYLASSPAIDFQPDQYYFNFPGQSGKFILKRDQSVILQSQQKIKITPASNGATFQITGLDGTVYDFGLKETYSDGIQTHTSAWYLTKITSSTGNIVTFNYTQLSNYVSPIGSYAETKDLWDCSTPSLGGGYAPTNALPNSSGSAGGKQYSQYILSNIDFPTGQVKFNYSTYRLDLSNDAELDSVQIFSKNKSGTLSSSPLKTVVLNYGYFTTSDQGSSFISSSTSDKTKRLKLLQVQDVGYYGGHKEVESPYKFTYCESVQGSNLPAKSSFARDHWGYWNGKSNSSLIPSTTQINSNNGIVFEMGADGPERDVDTSYLRAYSLTSIQYPTGGSTEFQYEANDFDEQASEVNDNYSFASTPNLVQEISSTSYDAAHNSYINNTANLSNEYWDNNQSNGGVPDVVVAVSFVYTSGNCSSISLPTNNNHVYCKIITPGGQVFQTIDLADYTVSAPNSDGSIKFDYAICDGVNPVFTIYKKFSMPPGAYTIQAASDASNKNFITAKFTWYERQIASPGGGPGASNYGYAGGLRIKRIIDHDGISSANDKVKKYIYHYWADKNNDGTPEEYSYGIRMTKPRYTYFDITVDVQTVKITGGCFVEAYYSTHMLKSSDSEYPLNGSAAGSVVGYSQVTELEGENGENGKKVYQYINQPDIVKGYNEQFTGANFPLRPPSNSTTPNNSNGELLHEVDYANVNGQFFKLKEVTNNYELADVNEDDVYGLENRQTSGGKFGDNCGTAATTGPCINNYMLTYTSLKSIWDHLINSDEKVYNQGDTTQYIETATNYTYDANTLLPSTTTITNSKGETITTYTTYPADYSFTTANDAFAQGIQNLQTKHVVAAPVEKYVQKANGDGTNIRTTGSVLTSYNSASPTPSLIYSGMFASPSTTFSAASINGSGNLSKDASYEALISFDSYDAYGNILQQHKINDNNHSYVWDYQNSLPVAEAINAQQSKIAYTSFEFDGTGGWTVASSSRSNSSYFTGAYSYSLSNGNISKNTGITAGDTLIVSYWSMNGSYTVTGSINTIAGKTVSIHGTSWTYYEHTITGVTAVTISGSGNIDELRLYPLHAQMTTYTFEPMIGMTGQCDVNNRASYYEYDGLGRLKDIKDQDGNILKTFEYHYKQ